MRGSLPGKSDVSYCNQRDEGKNEGREKWKGLDLKKLLKKASLLTRPTLARREAPYPMQGRNSLVLVLKRVAWLILDCARPTI
jgi:hypothetical protein